MKSFLIVFLFPAFMSAQSEFMDSSGFGLQAGIGYSASSELLGLGAEAGLSILGIFDMGLQYAKGDVINSSFNSSGTLFYFAFNSKRADNKNCIRILFGYLNEYLSYSPYGTFHASGPVAGVNFLLKTSENKIVTLMPELGILYSFLSVDTKSIYTVSSDQTRNIALGLNVIFHLSNSFSLIFSPKVSKDLGRSNNPLMFGLDASVFVN